MSCVNLLCIQRHGLQNTLLDIPILNIELLGILNILKLVNSASFYAYIVILFAQFIF